jgi:predicted small lipoprotein YifL
MSIKRLMLAAAVAIFGFSLAGCVDSGPYYGD